MEALLERRPADQIPLAEIARFAGVSVAGMVARYPDRESLLLALLARDQVRRSTDLDLALHEDAWLGLSLRERCQRLAETMVAHFRRRRATLVAAQERGYPLRFLPSLAGTRLLDAREEIRDADPERAVAWAIHVAMVTVQDPSDAIPEAELTTRLAHLLYATLTTPAVV